LQISIKKKIKLPFFCWVHPNTIDEETVKLLKYAGCYEVQMGVQTFSYETRSKILGRNTPNKNFAKSLRLFKKYNIDIVTDNLFGVPNQTEEELHNLALFYTYNLPTRLDVFYLRYYPKTDIIKISENLGILDKNKIRELNEARNVQTFTSGGDSYNKKLSQFQVLFYLLSIFPLKFSVFIIKNKLYRHFVQIHPILARLLSRFFNHSKYDMYRTFMFRKYLYYIPRRLFLRKL